MALHGSVLWDQLKNIKIGKNRESSCLFVGAIDHMAFLSKFFVGNYVSNDVILISLNEVELNYWWLWKSEWMAQGEHFLPKSPELLQSFFRLRQIPAKCQHLSRKRLLNCPLPPFPKSITESLTQGKRNAFSAL